MKEHWWLGGEGMVLGSVDGIQAEWEVGVPLKPTFLHSLIIRV